MAKDFNDQKQDMFECFETLLNCKKGFTSDRVASPELSDGEVEKMSGHAEKEEDTGGYYRKGDYLSDDEDEEMEDRGEPVVVATRKGEQKSSADRQGNGHADVYGEDEPTLAPTQPLSNFI
jgi:hypothetical protein